MVSGTGSETALYSVYQIAPFIVYGTGHLMSVPGYKQTFSRSKLRSALPPATDIRHRWPGSGRFGLIWALAAMARATRGLARPSLHRAPWPGWSRTALSPKKGPTSRSIDNRTPAVARRGDEIDTSPVWASVPAPCKKKPSPPRKLQGSHDGVRLRQILKFLCRRVRKGFWRCPLWP